jgi:TetR/AcrR family transcriptional regulator, cholesterol catabolism regulator
VEHAAVSDTQATEIGPNRQRLSEVVDAAAQVFYEKGYHAASVQDVANRIGILKGSLYHYITTKADLLYLAIEDQHLKYDQLVEDLSLDKAGSRVVLRRFVDGHVRLITSDVIRSTLFFREFSALPGERWAEIRRHRRAYEQFLRELIERGQLDGVFRRDLEAALATKAVLGMLNWTYTWYNPGAGWTADHIAETLLKMVEASLSGRPPGEPDPW